MQIIEKERCEITKLVFMTYLPSEIIKKKRDGGYHTQSEIEYLIKFYLNRTITDYQMSAWLMAVFFQGLSQEELAWLTRAMVHSGTQIDFSYLPAPAVDKHSTGGVGDKTSLIIGPIVAEAGLYVPMISGRGLGHTGGTLDKLESIPGFSTQLELTQFSKFVEKYGLCFIGQTQDICPADKKIYALRDVTGTVESLPLISASIMSKKIAEGIKALVLDVKCGTGAFMKSVEKAKLLAQTLCKIGHSHNIHVSAFVTNMNQPLGCLIGNSLEVEECLDIMTHPGRNPQFDDTLQLSIALAGQMIWLGGFALNSEEGKNKAHEILFSGKALKKFQQICEAQGGNLDQLPKALQSYEVLSKENGFIENFECESIGVASLVLGAGRKKWDDLIDPSAGIKIHKKIGDFVARQEPLFTLYASQTNSFEAAEKLLLKSIKYSLNKVTLPDLIIDKVKIE